MAWILGQFGAQRSRQIAGYIELAAYATGDCTLQQIADTFGVHYATVSRAVNGG